MTPSDHPKPPTALALEVLANEAARARGGYSGPWKLTPALRLEIGATTGPAFETGKKYGISTPYVNELRRKYRRRKL